MNANNSNLKNGLKFFFTQLGAGISLMGEAHGVTGKLGIAFESLASGLKLSTAGLGAFLGVAAGIVGISFIIKKVTDALVTYKEASDAAAEADKAYEDQKKKVAELNSELETMQERINELESKGGLTLTEASELQALREQTSELEKQVAFEERLAELRAAESFRASQNALNNQGFIIDGNGNSREKTWWDYFLEGGRDTENSVPGLGDQPLPESGGIVEYINSQIDSLDALSAKYDELSQKSLDETLPVEEAEEYAKQAAEIKNQMEDVEFATLPYIEELQGYKDTAETASEILKGVDATEAAAEAERLGSVLDSWMTATGELDKEQQAIAERQTKINDLLSRPTLTETVEEAEKLAKDLNGLTVERLMSEFPELASAIEAAGLDVQEVADTINSMAGAFDPAVIRQQVVEAMLGEADGSSAWLHQFDTLESKIAELSDEDIKILYTILPNIKEGWTFDDLEAAIEQYKNQGGEIDLSLETQTEQVTKLTESISSLQSALSAQSDIGTLSFDTYSAEGMEDYAVALERVNDGYQYNIEAVNEIVKVKAEERKAYLEVGKAQAQTDYLENARQIEKLVKNYDNLTDSQREELDNLRANADSLYADIQGFNLLSAEIDNATSAYQTWLNAQNAEDGGKMFSDVQTAIERMDDVLNDSESDMFNKLGDGKFQADLDLVLPDSVDKTDEGAIRSYFDDLKRLFVFKEDGSIMDLNFDQVFETLKTAGVMTDDLHIAQGKTLDDFAKSLNVSKSVAMSIVDYLNEFVLDPSQKITWTDEYQQGLGDILVEAERSADALRQMDEYSDLSVTMDVSEIEDADAAAAELDRSLETLKELRAKPGIDATEAEYLDNMIKGIVARKQILEAPVIMQINTNALTGNVKTVMETLQEFQEAQNYYEIQVEAGADTEAAESAIDGLVEKLRGLDYTDIPIGIDEKSTAEDIQQAIANLNSGEGYEILAKIVPDYAWLNSEEDAEQAMINVLVNDERYRMFVAEVEGSSISSSVKFTETHAAITQYLNSLNNIHKTITLDAVVTNTGTSSTSTKSTPSSWNRGGKSGAAGIANAGGSLGTKQDGRYLVGELGRELAVDTKTGRWYTVGDKGAQFVNLPKGSIVFNHEQTEDLLRTGNTSGRALAISNARALAGGNAFLSGGGGFDLDALMKRIEGGYTSSGGSLNTSSSSSRVSGSTKASGDEDNWFERMYAYHNHMLSMEQESVEDYLKWLDEAYQKAYNEQIIELEDYYQYQEEVFEKLRELYQDSLDDIDHTIEMLQHYQGTAPQIIEYYRSMMASIQNEIMAARAAGLTDNDDYIQELQDRWWEYHDAIVDIEETTIEDAEDALDELVQFRIDMLKKDMEAEKDSLNERLDNLKDFYDKQKEMLDDQADEEDYLKEQSEKRKAVSDLENELARLELDNSAWAQKRKLELTEELVEAREELEEFERDHALDMAKDQLDSQYELQRQSIQAELDALEQKLTSERALYDQALNDIRNDNGTLLQEMIEWNAQYGSFIDRDVTQMWNAASTALQNYYNLYDQWYNNVQLRQQQGGTSGQQSFAPSAGSSWSGSPMSAGANPAQPEANTVTSGTGSAASGSDGASGALGVGSRIKASGALIYGVPSGGRGYRQYFANDPVYVIIGESNGRYKVRYHKLSSGETGWFNKSDVQAYARGTDNALSGIAQVDELGPEYLFTSADGNKYRIFSGGEKVLTANATDFLYKFANSGGSVLKDMIANVMDRIAIVGDASAGGNIPQIVMGDIIVQGNADHKTVSEIRRMQDETVELVLKSFRKLK